MRALPSNSLDSEQGIRMARAGKRARRIREFLGGDQRTVEMRKMRPPAGRRSSAFAQFGVQQDGRPAALLREYLLAQDFGLARAVLA